MNRQLATEIWYTLKYTVFLWAHCSWHSHQPRVGYWLPEVGCKCGYGRKWQFLPEVLGQENLNGK
jgi:hypothetical protein